MTGRQAQSVSFGGRDFQVISTVIIILLMVIVAAECSIGGAPKEWIKNSTLNNDQVPIVPQNGQKQVNVTLLSQNGYTSEGKTTTVNFKVAQNNITKLVVTLQWTDDIGSNDELGLTLYYMDQKVDAEQGTSGHLQITFNGNNETGLNGSYRVDITAINCPGQVPNVPFDRDNGNSWTLSVDMTVLE